MDELDVSGKAGSPVFDESVGQGGRRNAVWLARTAALSGWEEPVKKN